jgi:hypothetical protein
VSKFKVGDEVWAKATIKHIDGESLRLTFNDDWTLWFLASDCRPVEPANSSEILDSSSDPLLLGDAVELQSNNVWRGTKGILTNWCPIKKAFWFESLDPSRKAISGWMKEQWDDEETGICRLVKIDHPNDSPKPDGSSDPINPVHYKHLPAEAIDIIEAAIAKAPSNQYAFLQGQVIKYLLRCWSKKGIEDLRKAKWYLDRLVGGFDDLLAEASGANDGQREAGE